MAQTTAGTGNDAFKIYEDLPLDVPGKTSVLKLHETVAEKIREHIFIKTVVSKNSCFVGEPLKLTYELYSELQNKSEISRRPSFAGFTVRHIDFSNDDDRHQKLNGKDYRVFTADKNIIIPYDTGKLQLDPVEVHNTVFYDDDKKGKQEYEGVVSSTALVISVLPLPAMKNGNVFSGAVGVFSMRVKPEKTVFAVYENMHVVIELTGNGNLSAVSLPVIRWPGAFEVFNGTEKQLDSLNDDSHSKRIFSITVVAKQPGKYAIDPICLTTFNPEKKSYETICTQYVELTVQKRNETNDEPVIFAKNQPAPHFQVTALVVAALGIVFTLLAWKKRNARIALQRNISSDVASVTAAIIPDYNGMANEALALENDADFIRSLKAIVRQHMGDETGINHTEPDEVLVNAVSAQDVTKADAVKSLIASCNYLLYAQEGITSERRNTMVNSLLKILNLTRS